MTDFSDLVNTAKDAWNTVTNLGHLSAADETNVLINQQAFRALNGQGVLYPHWADVPTYIRTMSPDKFLAAVKAHPTTTPTTAPAAAKPAGLPGWLIPAALAGAAVLFGALVILKDRK